MMKNAKYKSICDFIRSLYPHYKTLIPLHEPFFSGKEKEYLNECIDSTYVSSVGKYVDLFELKVSEFTGCAKAVACVNGTSALHIALKTVGVEPETEVITQSLTFVATANAISYCGAKPVFLDVDSNTMGLSPQKLKEWLQQNAKIDFKKNKSKNKNSGKYISACIPVNTYGFPCKIDEIIDICRQYHIPVVEDAAESMGSLYNKKHTGTFGNVGVLSFNGNKIITTGGGGMLLFNNIEQAKKAKHLTTQAKVFHTWNFVHDEIGYNYRMPNINAALGLSQMEILPQLLTSKRELANKYSDFFENNFSDITFIKEPRDTYSNYWLNTIIFPNINQRDEFLKYSNQNNIMTRPPWELMNNLKMYQNCQHDNLKNTIDISSRIVNLPSSVRI